MNYHNEENEQTERSQATSKCRVNECDKVYDENGVYMCDWRDLSITEQTLVKHNPASAR